MAKSKRLAALFLVLAMLLLAAGCGKTVETDDPMTTDTTTEIEITTEPPETTTEPASTEEDVSIESSTDGSTTTTKPTEVVNDTTKPGTTATTATTATPTTKPTTAPPPPEGKAAILAAYTAVVNKVKVDQPAYTSNDWQTMSNVDTNRVLYATLSTIAKSFLETYEESKPSFEQAGKHPKWFAMPTDTAKVGCVLTDLSKIESASCTKSGNFYVIKITLIQEKDPDFNRADPYAVKGWHGKLFDVIDITEVVDYAKNIPGVNADNAYCTFKGTATLKYDPVTNKCVTLDHVIDVRVHLLSGSAKVIADYRFYDFKW